jgi:hypothetical protein
MGQFRTHDRSKMASYIICGSLGGMRTGGANIRLPNAMAGVLQTPIGKARKPDVAILQAKLLGAAPARPR